MHLECVCPSRLDVWRPRMDQTFGVGNDVISSQGIVKCTNDPIPYSGENQQQKEVTYMI